MGNCAYYEIEQHQRPQSKTIGSNRQQKPIKFIDIPYCSHPSEEFSLKQVLAVIGSATKLKCQGNESKCQLTLSRSD